MLCDKVIPKLAFEQLHEFTTSKTLPREMTLLLLHSFFGELLKSAIKLLEKSRVICFETSDGCCKLYKIGNLTEQYTVYPDVNYCRCDYFRDEVLSGNALTCKHVLALKLIGFYSGTVHLRQVTGHQMRAFFNEQLAYQEDDE